MTPPKALDVAHPGFGERLFDEGGNLRRFVNVFMGEEDIRFLSGLATPGAGGRPCVRRACCSRRVGPGRVRPAFGPAPGGTDFPGSFARECPVALYC